MRRQSTTNMIEIRAYQSSLDPRRFGKGSRCTIKRSHIIKAMLPIGHNAISLCRTTTLTEGGVSD